jgi:hypothetical protein
MTLQPEAYSYLRHIIATCLRHTAQPSPGNDDAASEASDQTPDGFAVCGAGCRPLVEFDNAIVICFVYKETTGFTGPSNLHVHSILYIFRLDIQALKNLQCHFLPPPETLHRSLTHLCNHRSWISAIFSTVQYPLNPTISVLLWLLRTYSIKGPLQLFPSSTKQE